MEHKKIKTLLESYFEGNTTLKEERLLRNYFTQEKDIPEDIAPYKALFAYYEDAQKDVYPKKKKSFKVSTRVLAVAASIALLIALVPFQKTSISPSPQDEEAALLAYQQFKGSLLTVSKNLNQGIGKVNYVEHWNNSTQKLLK